MANQIQFSSSIASTSHQSPHSTTYDASHSSFTAVDNANMNADLLPSSLIVKGPKRKRLIKACDACHKSKRRCNGTAPCSNCWHAQKECKYTDANGRPIPAPNGIQRGQVNASPEPYPDNLNGTEDDYQQYPNHSHGTAPSPPEAGPSVISSVDTGSLPVQPRKRTRQDESVNGNTMRPSDNRPLLTVEQDQSDDSKSSDLKPSNMVTRELVNLFFAHCHPHCLVIHKPNFTHELSYNRVPPYLLNAIYALSAPLSRNELYHTNPIRCSGIRYAQQARHIIFDSRTDLLNVSPCLQLAQALCFLQIHEFTVAQNMSNVSAQYFNLALRVLNDLDVHQKDNPVMKPFPGLEHRHAAVERECLRRTYWLIHLIGLLSPVFVKGRIFMQKQEPKLRLPCDETNFELSTHAALSEYLNTPAPKTEYASEFGHIIRVATVFRDIEDMSSSNVCDPGTLARCERTLKNWVESLPVHLEFSASNLQLHMSMWETSSNTSAWCFCFMHNLHACCILVLSELQISLGLVPVAGCEHAQSKLCQIITTLGLRVCNSAMMGVVLWFWHFRLPTISPYNRSTERLWAENCTKVQKQIEEWLNTYRILWGLNEDETMSPEDFFDIQKRADPSGIAEDPSSNLAHSISRLGIHSTLRVPDRRNREEPLAVDSHRRNDRNGIEKTTASLPSLKSMGLLNPGSSQSHQNAQFVKIGSSSGRLTEVSSHMHLLPPIANIPPAVKSVNPVYRGPTYRYS